MKYNLESFKDLYSDNYEKQQKIQLLLTKITQKVFFKCLLKGLEGT